MPSGCRTARSGGRGRSACRGTGRRARSCTCGRPTPTRWRDGSVELPLLQSMDRLIHCSRYGKGARTIRFGRPRINGNESVLSKCRKTDHLGLFVSRTPCTPFPRMHQLLDRTATCPRTAWDNRTVIGVVADLPGWWNICHVDGATRPGCGSACVKRSDLDRVVFFRFARACSVQPQVPKLQAQGLPGDP